MKKRLIPIFGALSMLVCSPSYGAYFLDIGEIGGNVVASGSGSINLAALTFSLSSSTSSSTMPSGALVIVGSGPYSLFNGVSGPSNFGTGGLDFADSNTGGLVAIWGQTTQLAVPLTYVSGSNLGVSTSTWNNSTFASLGLTPGTYVWNWGRESSADSFTVRIGAVPEPATWAMMLFGFGFIGSALRSAKRRQKVAVSFA